jgi:hypothetical protein
MPIAHRATDWIISDVTNVLKSDAMPGADESYRHREEGLSQKAYAISSESSRLSCWNVEGAYSNMSRTIVTEEGCQKSKRLPYTAKFKREVIRCAQKKGNRKATAIFGVDESNVRLLRKHKASISGCDASRRKFTGPKKGWFPETGDAVLALFQETHKTGLFVSYALLCKEAIKKARSLNIPRSRFKANKGCSIRCMRQMGLVLRRRMTICRKLPKYFEQKLLNHQQYITNLQKTGNFLMVQIAMLYYSTLFGNYCECRS